MVLNFRHFGLYFNFSIDATFSINYHTYSPSNTVTNAQIAAGLVSKLAMNALPVVGHFHFSRDNNAVAGKRNANDIPWTIGKLEVKVKTQKL